MCLSEAAAGDGGGLQPSYAAAAAAAEAEAATASAVGLVDRQDVYVHRSGVVSHGYGDLEEKQR